MKNRHGHRIGECKRQHRPSASAAEAAMLRAMIVAQDRVPRIEGTDVASREPTTEEVFAAMNRKERRIVASEARRAK